MLVCNNIKQKIVYIIRLLYLFLFFEGQFKFYHRTITLKDTELMKGEFYLGKEDITTLRYFEDSEHFAELVNGIIFDGQTIIEAKKLKDVKRDLLYPKTRKGKEVYRDSVKKYCDEAIVQLYVLEHQEYIDYHMVLRNMLSEALEYDRQWQEIKKEHLKKKDLKEKDEFLSGMKISDRFMPVITLVIYYGEKKWNAPTSLHELMDWGEADEKIKRFVENYHIHVFDYHDYDDFDMFYGELRQVFSFLKYSKDKYLLRKHLAEHEMEYYNISEETCEFISAITHSEELLKLKDDRKEGINMCKALQDIRLEGVEEGIQVLITDYLEEGFTKEKIIGKLQKGFHLSLDDAEQYFERFATGQ